MSLELATVRLPGAVEQDRNVVDHKIRDLARRGMEMPDNMTTDDVQQACFALHVLCALLDYEKRERRSGVSNVM